MVNFFSYDARVGTRQVSQEKSPMGWLFQKTEMWEYSIGGIIMLFEKSTGLFML